MQGRDVERPTSATRDLPSPANATGPGPGTHAPTGNGHDAHAQVYPLRDVSDTTCPAEVELVIFRFISFGRLAHFRRSLLALPGVRAARIASYGDQTALFSLSLTPGTSAGSLVLPGTRLIGSNGFRVELCVEG